MVMEGYARMQGHYDYWRKREHHIWQAASSTKELEGSHYKLLPILKSKIRKEDKLSINGPGIMTAVIRAEQHGAELVAQRIKKVVESAPVRVGGRGRTVNVMVAYSSLTFASPTGGSMTVSGPHVEEEAIAAFASNPLES